jgi:pyruvate dehydrogenase E2 component (dihydrolipoamide acetyltransferase)
MSREGRRSEKQRAAIGRILRIHDIVLRLVPTLRRVREATMATTLRPMKDASSFRRIAAGMWHHPNDPTIYGSMDVDVTNTLRFIERFRQERGVRLSVTHIVTRAVAHAFARHPDLNAKVRLWGRLEQRDSVDLFVSVSTEGGRDLSGARVERAEALSLEEIVAEVSHRARSVREGDDKDYARSRDLFRRLPWWLARPALRCTDFLTNELHLHLPSLGMPRDAFGTAIVTNVGMFGVDTAFAPFMPVARCPMILLVTEVRQRPWVVGDTVVPRPVLRLCGTFDHRVIDGYHAGLLAKEIRALVENPEEGEADVVPVTAAHASHR